MDHYVVEVEVSTHDDLQRGVLALPRALGGQTYSRVVLSKDEVTTDQEAVLVAAQIACCTSGGMPTATRLLSWPFERM